MNYATILKVALRALARNKVRSLLTTLGIIVGIAAVIAMLSVGQGATAAIQEEIKSMGDNLLIIFPGSMRTGGFHSGSGGQHTLTNEDGEAILKEVSYATTFTPVVRSSAQIVFEESNWSTSIQGVNGEYPAIRNWEVAEGDFFTESDIRSASRVCLLGQTVVDKLFESEDPIGKTIRVRNMPFRVIGVMTKKGTAAFGQDQDDAIIAPWTTVRRVLQNSPFNDVNQLMITLSDMSALDQVTEDITSILRQRHHLAEDAEDDFSIMDTTEITKTITQVSRVMTSLLTVIASISLFVGGIGIMNIMLVSVTERTREIGLRMALGARRKDVLRQFIVESIVLSGIGGIIGVILGIGAAITLSKIASWPVLISSSYIIVALSFSGAVGIFFGFYPAWRASKLNPIEALRNE